MVASMTPTLSFKEKQLIQNCINGNKRSQKKLYHQFHNKMYMICFRYIKNRVETEDILQDAFIKLFKKLPTFKAEGSFDGWVRRIFVNTALEYLRDKKQSSAPLDNEESFLSYTHVNALDALYEKDIIDISQKLDKGYSTIFNLYAVKGYSHKEIAQQLGITESTSKSQLSRAKAKLRNMMLGRDMQEQELLSA